MFATIHAWWTVLLLLVFIGIVVWAWSSKRKTAFDEAARLALDESEQDQNRPAPRGGRNERRGDGVG